MNNSNFNTWIIITFIYASSISVLFFQISSPFLIKSIIVVTLLILTVILNTKKLNKYFLGYLISLIIIIGVNTLFVENPMYVLGDGINLLLYSAIPFYIFSTQSIRIEELLRKWHGVAVVFTLLMPIYYILRMNYVITYYEIGLLAYYNILAIFIYNKFNKSFLNLFMGAINLIILGILGSRMVFIASILSIFVIFLVFSSKRKLSYYIKIFSVAFASLLVFTNLLSLLTALNVSLTNRGINSRNLSLFIQQLQGTATNDSILSGRQEIYPVVIEYIKENGFFPSGFGVARTLTQGKYYHSHNFLTEMILIFGLIGLVLVGALIFFQIYKNKNRLKVLSKSTELKVALVLLSSFLFRSITGTHFVTDVIFLISIAILLNLFAINETYNKTIKGVI
ncbi:O-antigen ligase family protein [Exiguobacterium aurantiacum]|uniref:O-antigen ligase-related domain-containing protein n=1 Tax=Exiguobacterium aurantiacum TaxID=33987 RepID=A0ABY5FQ48_9BACL|nr:O-antigen ligase family protein [Exiguobacterium aurantiacum]UTT43519.1 hypothetical protein NMQ00_03185 [Exiguobacterium aurantiacum]